MRIKPLIKIQSRLYNANIPNGNKMNMTKANIYFNHNAYFDMVLIMERIFIKALKPELNLNQSIVNDLFDSNQSNVSNFKIRLGRSRQTKYTTPSGSFLIQSANSFIHWEFSRVIQMGEERNKISISNWNSKHESRILELAMSIKNNKKLH